MTDVVRSCVISPEPLSVDAVLAAITDPRCGGEVLFLGRLSIASATCGWVTSP